MTRSRIHTLVVIVMLVLAVPARAGAADDADTIKAKKAAAAAKLDAAKADDAQLESAVQQLDAGVAVQSRDTEAAKQAANVADAAADMAAVRLANTEKKAADLRTQASAVAVQAYIHPASASFLELMKASDLSEAARRQALMSQVVQTDRDVLGQLRAVREDQQAQQANLVTLRDQAEARKKDATDKLNALQKLLADQTRLKSALDVRIQEYTSEVDALNREEANLQGLIRSRELSGASADGKPISAASLTKSAAGLIWPADGPISSPFGMRWGAMHTGIDIDCGYGAPIRAAKTGTVISAGWYGGYGNATIIDHGGGFTTLYGHQSQILVSEGQVVTQGQVIGYAGATGNVTGPHLHFETRVNGDPVNPMNYLP